MGPLHPLTALRVRRGVRTAARLHTLVVVLVVAACSTPVDQSFPTAEITVGDEELTVWVADESQERRQGLRNVDELPSSVDGMLFAYATPVSASFTMEETLIPLDIWWFDEQAVLLGSSRMEPCSGDPCTSYGSPGPIRWAVETSADRYDFPPGSLLSTTGTG